jgi:hypothetical protein
MNTLREKKNIIIEFNQSIKNLIVKFEKRARTDTDVGNLDRIKKRLSLLKSTMGENQPIILAAPVFISYHEQILNRDETFFMTLDVQREYTSKNGRNVDSKDEFIFEIIAFMRKNYSTSSQKDKDDLYSIVKSMFDCCLEYEISK